MKTFWWLLIVGTVAIGFRHSSPTQLAFWLPVGLATLLASPYLGVWQNGFMWIRTVVLLVGGPLFIAFVLVRNPESGKFWIVFGGVLFVAAPMSLVQLMFLKQIRTHEPSQ